MSSVNNICMSCYPLGLTIPYTNSDNGYFQQTFDTNSRVKQNLMNFINTQQGERRFQPTLGTRLRSLLFEFNDPNTREIARNILTDEFFTWVPEIIIDNISINNVENSQNVDNYKLLLAISYTVKQTKQQESVSIVVTKN